MAHRAYNLERLDHVPVILKDHITHASGRGKTVCVTACLTALGVPFDSYHYTGSAYDNVRESILRRNGYAVRSRLSAVGGMISIGAARKKIKQLRDPAGTRYLVVVSTGKRATHAMLLDADGETIVDTAPRKRDKRRILSIKAVFKQPH